MGQTLFSGKGTPYLGLRTIRRPFGRVRRTVGLGVGLQRVTRFECAARNSPDAAGPNMADLLASFDRGGASVIDPATSLPSPSVSAGAVANDLRTISGATGMLEMTAVINSKSLSSPTSMGLSNGAKTCHATALDTSWQSAERSPPRPHTYRFSTHCPGGGACRKWVLSSAGRAADS